MILEVRELNRKLLKAQKEYGEQTISQTKLVQQISIQNSLLRDIVKKIDEKRTPLSKLEDQLYAVENTLQLRIRELNEVNSNYKENIQKLEEVQRSIKKEREVFYQEREESLNQISQIKSKVEEEQEGISLLKKDYDKKFKDLKVVEKRLRKLWPKDKLFPRIHE